MVADPLGLSKDCDQTKNGGGDGDGDGGKTSEQKAQEDAKKKREEQVRKRVEGMKQEGHSPQRHGPTVTDQQLTDRAVNKIDPMTGTATDGVHGGQHKCGRDATRINSDEALVKGDEQLRNSSEFEAAKIQAEKDGESSFTVERPLKDIYGESYQENVSGVRRGGSNNYPTGNPPGSAPPTQTNFEDGTLFGVYKKNPNGGYDTYTMFPKPKS